MQTSVDLQKPFEYSILLGLILLGLVLLPLITYGIYKLVNYKPPKREVKKKAEKKVVKVREPLDVLKTRYLQLIDKVEAEYKEQVIDQRESYIRLSSLVRNFVHDVTDIDVQNFTLAEIDKLGMEDLTALIAKFYNPEFSYEDQYTEISMAFADARKVVSSWK